jgi:hypothetical protein
MRKRLLITVTLLAALLLLGGCIPGGAPEQPSHDQFNFQLFSDAEPGDTDNYARYNISLYLERGQKLDLDFSAQGASLMLSLFSPSELTFGYVPYEKQPNPEQEAEDGKLGWLKEGMIVASPEGSFLFTVPETGYFVMTVESASPKAEIDVQIEYQIQ